jgi:thiamine pyrophosphate-dependent acetolactate synthase large subunit-like protein
VALAQGHGCRGQRVDNPAQLADALAAALKAKAPYLLEVAVA